MLCDGQRLSPLQILCLIAVSCGQAPSFKFSQTKLVVVSLVVSAVVYGAVGVGGAVFTSTVAGGL